MGRINYMKLSLAFSSFLMVACATYNENYADSNYFIPQESLIENGEPAHVFYLIGDAGNATLNEELSHLQLLRKELNEASKNTTVLFLGDNIYEKGLPKKEHPERKLAEHRLDAQINLVENFNGETIFIPGNHDYYSNGIKGLKRQEDYVIDRLGKGAFLPKDGCPLKKVDISEDIVLIIVDSQWYLENWDKNPTMNDDCEIKTRLRFFQEYESLIKKNTDKTILVSLHHPLFSNGPHGGQFSLKSQLFPVKNSFALPGIGTFINVLRRTSGASPQDMNNPLYLELKKRIVTISQRANRVIFASGHEHSLQYIEKDNIPQIVSGSGSKKSAARAINGGYFSYGGLGYAKLIIYKDRSAHVAFFTEENGQNRQLFSHRVHEASQNRATHVEFPSFPKSKKAAIYSKSETDKSGVFKLLWGDHYRKYYSIPVEAPTVNIDTLFGGLTPTRKGGGNQSKSLRLEDSQGREFVMRALRKSATQYIQAVAFKDHYVEGQFDDTYTEKLLLDIYTAAHPYAPFTIGTLADAAQIYHTNPTLYYIPKQKGLKHYNDAFGDELYMIEERAASGHGNQKSFGYSNKLISTDDLLKNLRKSDDYKIDESSYMRARIFDMLIGDWDRHEDQWRWASFKEGNKTIYKPVPRDRDQAFSKNDGLILGFITRTIPALKLMQVYDGEMRSVKWFNLEPYPLDMALVNKATRQDWIKEAEFLQNNISEDVIEKAFLNIPEEVRDETIDAIKVKLKNRLKNIVDITNEYYQHLAKYAVVKGTDKDNWFEIVRKPNGITEISVFNIKDDKKGSLILQKSYSKEDTKEIWVYGMDDKDIFKVSGNQTSAIPLRLIGGQNNDEYIVEKGNRVTIYDYKSKSNTFSTNTATKKLRDDYETNTYNHKKLKYSQSQFIPSLGSNPDDGFKVGFNHMYSVHGFERNPFTTQHILNAAYYFANSGFDVHYSVEFANIINKWNFKIESAFTSPNYSINHFGFGNNSVNFEETEGDDFHRVRIAKAGIAPMLVKQGRMGSTFKIGANYEQFDIENTNDRFVNSLDPDTFELKKYVGFEGAYSYENYDNHAFPTMGMNFLLKSGWRNGLENSDNYGYLNSQLGFNYKIASSGALVFATKLDAYILFGDDLQLYNAASIGGQNGLRGYRNQRFSGEKSFYQNSDLRLNLKSVKTGLLPIQIGIFGGFDYGRVWLDGEDSDDWKTAAGAGIWIVGAEMLNINLSVFDSKDGAYVNFGLGFGF